jgi:hypothetical protein
MIQEIPWLNDFTILDSALIEHAPILFLALLGVNESAIVFDSPTVDHVRTRS